MEDLAMSYEYLIRRAQQCGRFGVAGANADIYRKLQRDAKKYFSEKTAINEKRPRSWNQTETEMLKNYMISAGEVSAYIKTAVKFVLINYSEKLTETQQNELEAIMLSIMEPDLEKLDDAVKRAEKIMLEIGLYPK